MGNWPCGAQIMWEANVAAAFKWLNSLCFHSAVWFCWCAWFFQRKIFRAPLIYAIAITTWLVSKYFQKKKRFSTITNNVWGSHGMDGTWVIVWPLLLMEAAADRRDWWGNRAALSVPERGLKPAIEERISVLLRKKHFLLSLSKMLDGFLSSWRPHDRNDSLLLDCFCIHSVLWLLKRSS